MSPTSDIQQPRRRLACPLHNKAVHVLQSILVDTLRHVSEESFVKGFVVLVFWNALERITCNRAHGRVRGADVNLVEDASVDLRPFLFRGN